MKNVEFDYVDLLEVKLFENVNFDLGCFIKSQVISYVKLGAF